MQTSVAGAVRASAVQSRTLQALSDNNDYGSAHANGFGMALCDGSVRTISYSIDLTTHGYLANRKDGHVVDQSKFVTQ